MEVILMNYRKKISILLFAAFLTLNITACNSNIEKDNSKVENSKIITTSSDLNSSEETSEIKKNQNLIMILKKSHLMKNHLKKNHLMKSRLKKSHPMKKYMLNHL